MSVCVQYPSAGCIVEYLEGNAIQIALVTEESGGKLRLLLPNRRETRLTTSRLLPWAGPALGSVPGKDESARVLEQHRARREELAAALPVLELWEMSQGEVPEASAQWFAELAGQAGDADSVAACARAASPWGVRVLPSPVPLMIPAPQAHWRAETAYSDTVKASA